MVPSRDSPAGFAALAADLMSQPDEALTSRAIVERMVEMVPDAEQVSLTIRIGRRRHRTLSSSGEMAATADALQYQLAEGPCVEIADNGGWLRSGDVGNDERWPRWGARASELGVGSLLSVAIVDSQQPRGALNLYSTRTGLFADRDVVDLALVYAVHATNALTSARIASGLHTAMSSRHVIGMAQGVVMERYGLDEHASFELLRRISSTENLKLRDVAARVVQDRTVPGLPATED